MNKALYEKYLEIIKKENVELLDIKIVNFIGLLKHFTFPIRKFDKKLFEIGIGADGSSIGGYAHVENSDIRVIPDIQTGFLDPFFKKKTLSFIGDVYYADADERFPLCPRAVAKNVEIFIKEEQLADNIMWNPELEFYLFDGYNLTVTPNYTFMEFISDEINNEDNYGYKLKQNLGYAAIPPYDKGLDFRVELQELAEKNGIKIKVQHHECGVPGQHEVELDFDTHVKSADNIIIMKYFIKNLAHRYGKVATFMPKPLYHVAGSGMHLHQFLVKKGNNIFSKNKTNNLSQLALNYIGGILKHAPSLTALTNPSTNSYKRLVPGYEAPTTICYSSSNRTSAIRIPGYIKDPQKMRFEYRPPDAMANPYFALSALFCAGYDGLKNKIDPGKPAKGNVEHIKKYKKIPTNLFEALKFLKKDHDYLLNNGIFNQMIIDKWIKLKEEEAIEISNYPNPKEIENYFNY